MIPALRTNSGSIPRQVLGALSARDVGEALLIGQIEQLVVVVFQPQPGRCERPRSVRSWLLQGR